MFSKRYLIVFLALALFLAIPLSVSHAKNTPVTKLGRGICNLCTFHFEIFEQSRRVKKEQGWVAGLGYGMAKGVYMAVKRAIVGAYEVTTFFIPGPENYGPIMKDPVSFFPGHMEPQPELGNEPKIDKE